MRFLRSPPLAPRGAPPCPTAPTTTASHQLAQLQRTAGNSAVSRLASGATWLGAGRPLAAADRGFMESRLGLDLSGVRVHDGRAAAASARALGARAYAIGRDIAFAPGEFQPQTAAGRSLLAHELTHVAQQARSGTPVIQRQPQKPRPEWETQLDDLLPRRVGLITHIARIQELFERFSEDELRVLVGLIHANADARKLTNDFGVPGIMALEDTRVGSRLDVPAARTLLTLFPTRPATPRKSLESKPEVFAEDIIREAYVRFHYNALLPRDREHFVPDLPEKVRQNCIAIVHDMAPRMFTEAKVAKQIKRDLAKLRQKSETHTMVHAGKAFVGAGVAHKAIEIKFKDAAGKATNGNTRPTTLGESAWKRVMDAVGEDYGWHMFGMSIMSGHHSVTLFVDNQPGAKRLFWADQWFIDQDFRQMPGAISGFREYSKDGFDPWLEQLTTKMWDSVFVETSKCAERAKLAKRNWKNVCKYTATLQIWHMRRTQ